MPASDLLDIERRWSDLESLADRTPGIDPWCSGPDWIFPSHRAFGPEGVPIILDAPGVGVALLAQYERVDGPPVIAGLEPLWGFACPLLTSDPAAFGEVVAANLHDLPDWSTIVLPGLPLDGQLARAFAGPLRALGEIRAATGISRQVADLSDGDDAWLAKRSARFRRNLRRAQRHAEDVGLEITNVSEDPAVFERCRQIEGASWKGQDGDGIVAPEMGEFYRMMIERLQIRGRLRASIATLDGKDVGFIFGGVRGRRYRGLQLSFSESVRELSVSHLLQRQEIKALADAGAAVYDLGMDMEYKRRWADREEGSLALIIDRQPVKRRRFGGAS